MYYSTMNMEKPNPEELSVYREERFRVPSRTERELGLWVDRIGEAVSRGQLGRLRILGQFCHVFVLKGEGVYTSRQYGTHAVKAGDCMVQLPEDPCAYYPDGAWKTRWITWNGPEADTLYELGYISHSTPLLHDTEILASRIYDQLHPIMQRGDRADVLRRKSLVIQMVLALHDMRNRSAGTALGFPRIEESLHLIHAQYNEDMPIPELARQVGLSETHFRRRFRSYTGRSPLEYITELRIAEAKRLLREGFPIKQVASDVGYSDHFYFMRVFKKITGTPPGAYAKRHCA